MAWNPSTKALSLIKAGIFAAALIPLGRLGWGAYAETLGANPIEFITRSLGEWTLIFLMLTLAVTPLRRLSGWNWLLRMRRMLGLYAFFYGALHLMTYLWLDQFFDLASIVADIAKRPFITVGFSAFVLMLPLAATSNSWMIRRMGGRRWQKLHRAVYAVGIFGVLHYWWLVKKDVSEPLIYAAILTLLLGFRAVWLARERSRQLAAGTGGSASGRRAERGGQVAVARPAGSRG